MRVSLCTLATMVALAVPAIAQQPAAAHGDNTECAAEMAAMERDVDVARAKGQMLRRQQLAGALATLQARCEHLPADASRAANIEKLEHEVRDLRLQLGHAEEQLRKLKSEAP